ncbi:sugar phosphate nucleotidyltransferase [Paenibacillus assamensis]|uniref:sugar phosphate nucleotidyltransferase n=1 Tax=Paenibacillus assamensis TaxID=311244 RepID=UPI00041B41F4|nr:sugar phosphate nucleotidyltransferase [Paenibacillus assamensis]
MKGVILAGGLGTRLFPLTKVTNKHLLPVGKYPMIYHAIYRLKQAQVNNILIVSGREHVGDIVNLLGSGSEFELNLTYKVQEEAGGIAQALLLAEHFVGNDRVIVLLGDNVFDSDISSYIKRFQEQNSGAKILLHEVNDPQRYGVAELQGERIVAIEEKPLQPKSQYAVTGIYMFDSNVFDIIKTLKPSSRGELEITDVNNAYIEKEKMTYDILRGWWTDAGTHHSLARANELAQFISLGVLFGDVKL